MFPPPNEDHVAFVRTAVSAGDFRRLRLIGAGDVGKIFLVEWIGHNRYFAMKRLSKADMLARNKVRRVKEEREILASARHPFILTLFFAFHDDEHLYYITELCAGNLYEVNAKIGPLKEAVVKQYAAEVLSALEYLHLLGIAYRDLKPENILIGLDGHVRLADFDLSKKVSSVTTAPVQTTRTPFQNMLRMFSSDSTSQHVSIATKPMLSTTSLCGTPEYLSPEVIAGPSHSAVVDFWALGVLIFELLYGHTPFHGATQEAIFNAIKSGVVRFPDTSSVSSEAKSLIKKLLVVDPTKRLGAVHGAGDVKNHKWFRDIDFQMLRAREPLVNPKSIFRGFFDYMAALEESIQESQQIPVTQNQAAENSPSLSPSHHPDFENFGYASKEAIQMSLEIQKGIPSTGSVPDFKGFSLTSSSGSFINEVKKN
ncbi:hypothetical protein RCL1_001077 [Eukaryota sp. TZLM3-RCL]